ncbi:MAG: response regulator [Nitrososphaeraceae archaeon]
MAKDVTNNNTNNNWILVLDDEFDLLHLITELLKRHGFSAYGFTEPLLALEHFQANSKDYSLVISDIRMPVMTGFEFVRKVKAVNSGVKLLLMTAFDIADIDLSKALPSSIKINSFVRKPFRTQELVKLVNQQLST